MEKNKKVYNFERDKLGIIPNVEEINHQYYHDMDLIFEKAKLNNPENIAKLSEIIKNNNELIEEMQRNMKYDIVNDIIAICDNYDSYNTREYFIDKSPSSFIDFSPYRRVAREYLEQYIEEFYESYSEICEIIDSELQRLESKLEKSNDKLYEKIEDRIEGIKEFAFAGGLDDVTDMDEYEDMDDIITEYILDNKYQFVDLIQIFNDLKEDIINDKDLNNYPSVKADAINKLKIVVGSYIKNSNNVELDNENHKTK